MGWIKAIIFDMDGTIIVPHLDFALIKSEIGLPPERGLLEGMSGMSSRERRRAEDILERHELEAARGSRLNEGVRDALERLRRAGLRTAIVTRNSRRSVDIVLEKHDLAFDAVITRADCAPKPDPEGVLAAAGAMGVEPGECVMVGDYEFDIRAGRAAGALTVLFAPVGRDFAAEPDFEIRSFAELPGLVEELSGG